MLSVVERSGDILSDFGFSRAEKLTCFLLRFTRNLLKSTLENLKPSINHANMQNRGNRNLLFGTRPTGFVGNATTESLEADNQRAVERLGGSATSMRDVAVAIDGEVADQKKILDRVDVRFDSTSNVVSSTLAQLNDLVSDRTAVKMSSAVAAFFVLLLVLYYLYRR